MRIQVECRRTKTGATEPRFFLLGSERLWVLRVTACEHDALRRRFTVRTTDGRRFAIEEICASGEWRLAAALAPVSAL